MAKSHPYISGAGNLSQMVRHLRDNFPKTVTSETVKKFGLAPNNESYVINALQFIGVIGEDGKQTPQGADVFSKHSDEDFQKAFEGLVRTAYDDLFDVRGDKVWELTGDDLISYFRSTDKTSSVIGQRQAKVFQTFATLAGHPEVQGKSAGNVKPKVRSQGASATEKKTKKAAGTTPIATPTDDSGSKRGGKQDFALTVRIEINLPSNGTRENYDDIFRSIKENLMP